MIVLLFASMDGGGDTESLEGISFSATAFVFIFFLILFLVYI